MATTVTHDSATRMMNGDGKDNTIAGLKAQNVEASKLVEALEQGQRDLAELASTTLNETERLAAIVNKRQVIQAKVMRSANKEVKEHYKSVLASVKKQEDFVRETVRMEEERNKLAAEHERLLDLRNKKQAKLEVVDKEHLERMEIVSALLQKQSTVINARIHAEREGLKTGKEIAGVHKQITESMEQQAAITKGSALSEKYNEQMKGMRENAGKFGFEIDGLTKKQSLFVHGMSSVAGFLSYRKALELGKKGLVGMAEAADAATEARYRYGTSLSKHDKGVGTYLSDSYKMVSMNADVSLSFARMGLDADDAKDIIPKILAKNGTAMRYYADGNNAALSDMAKSAGAFSRQTGVSVDEALELQSELMEAKQMTSKQADDAMTSVAGSIRGMNDALQDAGFKGALLNVGQMTELVTEAAKSAETASFNVEAYAKNLSKAAGAARAFGMSEKSAAQYAKTKADASKSQDGYAELQRGRALATYMDTQYGADAKTGNTKKLTARLMAEQNMAEEDAEGVASMLVDKAKGKNVTMFENRLARKMQDTKVNQKVFHDGVMEYINSKGYTLENPPSVNDLESDVLFLHRFGLNFMDKEAARTAQGAIAEWKEAHGAKGTHVNKVITDKALEEKQKAAKDQANAEGTASNSSLTLARLKNYGQAIWDHPITSIVAGGTLAGVTKIGLSGIKESTGGKGLGGKIMDFLGRSKGAGTVPAAEGLGASASSLVPGLVDNAGREVAETAERSAVRAALPAAGKMGFKGFLSSVLKNGVKANKTLAAVVGVGTLAAATGGYLWAHNSTDKDTNAKDADTKSPEAQKKNAAILSWMQQNGVTSPNDVALAQQLLSQGADPRTVADQLGISPEAISQAFDPNTGEFGPTSNTTIWSRLADGYNSMSPEGQRATMQGTFGLGTHLAGKGIGKLANMVAPGLMEKGTGKLASAALSLTGKAAGGFAAKSAARAIPILGAALSPILTAYQTEGGWGRKLFAAAGDLGGTALGQFLTGGVGGGIVGGAAGQYAGTKAYDALFGGNSADAVAAMANAQTQTATGAPAGTPTTATGANPILTAGGIGAFSSLGSNGNPKLTIPITLDVAGFTQVVQQANSFNLARQTQYSGAKT